MLLTTISSKGQVSIPKGLRQKAGLAPGTQLEVALENGAIVLRKIVPRFRRWRGVLAGTNAVGELEAEHRREVEEDRAWAGRDEDEKGA